MRSLDELIAFVESLSGPDAGFEYHNDRGGKWRYDEITGERYLTPSHPPEATVWGSKADFLTKVHGPYGRELLALLKALRTLAPAQAGGKGGVE